MFNLPENNIHLSAQADNKQQAIELVAQALEQAGYVEAGYLQGMLAREQQTSTFLGNGIAIPHGTLDTRAMVKNTGVQVFQFPQGIEWGEGNIAYVVIGIAAKSDEHLALLRQLTHVLGDEEVAASLAHLQDGKKFRAILMGEDEAFKITEDLISLNIDTQSLLTLTAINAGKLQQKNMVDSQFVADVVSHAALPLTDGLWVTDSLMGNKKNGIALSRAKNAFEHNGKKIQTLLTISAVNEQLDESLARLLDPQIQQVLLNGEQAQIIAALNGQEVESILTHKNADNADTALPAGTVIGTFTIRNEHGLHARPSAVLVNTVKKFSAKINVQNLSRNSAEVSAKSLMKIVALGVTQGHRLRFVAQGDDAQQAIEAIGQEIANGLGESVSAVPPAEPDTIEVGGNLQAESQNTPAQTQPNADEVEGIFTIHNEHGLHARPSAVLVNEVKKYNANVMVQNLDRNSALVSAKSLMKIVALGVTKGQRLRFTATGEQAQQAIDGIGQAIANGLGE